MRKAIFFIVFFSCVGLLIYFYHRDDLNIQQVESVSSKINSENQEAQVNKNKEIIRTLYNAIENNNLSEAKSVLGNNYKVTNYGSMYDHPAGNADKTKTYQEATPSLMANITYIHRAFSNVKLTITDILAEGDQVFVSSEMAGNQTGQWMGYAPTGKRLILHLFAIYVVENGKIVKVTDMHNDLNVLQQLGYMPVK